MQTDDLIDTLTLGLKPMPRRKLEQRIGLGMVFGGVLAFALMLTLIGLRADLHTAVYTIPFWVKGGYALTLAFGAATMTLYYARPEARDTKWLWIIALPIVALIMFALDTIAGTSAADIPALIYGRSWQQCPINIFMLAIPVFAALVWTMRQLAPTRLRYAGAVTGLLAGSIAASIYGLHCPETSPVFLLIWYNLGIALMTLVGFLTGTRLLRW